MLADRWPYESLKVAVAAQPERVHLSVTAVAQGAGWGKPIPHTMRTFAGPRSGHLPPSFRVTYYCVGPQGATQLVLRVSLEDGPADRRVWAYDLGYHATAEQYEGQLHEDDCHLLPAGHCYYDGGGLNAEQEFGDKVLAAGPERWEAAAFQVVIEYYESVFNVVIDRETLAWSPAVEAVPA